MQCSFTTRIVACRPQSAQSRSPWIGPHSNVGGQEAKNPCRPSNPSYVLSRPGPCSFYCVRKSFLLSEMNPTVVISLQQLARFHLPQWNLAEMEDTGAVAYCGQQLICVSIAIAAAQIIVVGARFYTRYMQKVACGSDDYFIIPALVRTCLIEYEIRLNLSQIASLGQSALYVFCLSPSQVPDWQCDTDHGCSGQTRRCWLPSGICWTNPT